MFGAGFFAIIFYLAIYFQSVLGSSATKAGIQLLPLLIATVLSSIVTGGLITAIGYYVPIMLVCMALYSIGAGLLTTLTRTTPFGKWFGYQVLAGSGIGKSPSHSKTPRPNLTSPPTGVGFQAAILVVQTAVPLSDVPIGTACVSFFQTLGGAIFIAVAQTIFQNSLLSGIQKYSPQLPAQLFLESGATQIRSILKELGQEDQLDAVLQAYVDGLTDAYWITAACAIAGFFIACGLSWKNIKAGPGQGDKNAKTEGEGLDEKDGEKKEVVVEKREEAV